MRECVWYTVKDSSHTHTLSYCCKSHHSALPCSAGWECQQGSEGLPPLSISLSFSEAGFLVITLTPSHTHTHLTPSLCPTCGFHWRAQSSRAQHLSFSSLSSLPFPVILGHVVSPEGVWKMIPSTPHHQPPQNIHYWNILNSSPTFQSPSKCHNSTLAQKKTWNIIKSVHKSTDIGDKYSLSYGCKEFCLVYILYLNVLVTFVHQH